MSRLYVQDTLRPHETAAVERAGQITAEEWMGRVFSGDEKARERGSRSCAPLPSFAPMC